MPWYYFVTLIIVLLLRDQIWYSGRMLSGRFPELKHLPKREWRHVCSHAFRDDSLLKARYSIWLIVSVGGAVGLVYCAAPITGVPTRLVPPIALLPWLWSEFAFLRYSQERMARNIRQRLLRMGMPLCQNCGYDLRGQNEPRCPECQSQASAEILPKNIEDVDHLFDVTENVRNDDTDAEAPCPSCGEPVPTTFETCWNCGTSCRRVVEDR